MLETLRNALASGGEGGILIGYQTNIGAGRGVLLSVDAIGATIRTGDGVSCYPWPAIMRLVLD